MSRNKKWGELDTSKVVNFYRDHSNKQTQKYFHIGRATLLKILADARIPRHSKEENHQFTSIEKYGTPYYRNPEKVLETKINRYGTKSPGMDKLKETNITKYGHPYYFQTDEFKTASKNTCEERYGDPNYRNYQKHLDTIKSRYGVNNVSELDWVKDKISKSNTGKKRSPEYVAKMRADKTGKHLSPEKLKIKLSKEYITKKLNNSFNTSKPEEELYKQLLKENVNKTIYRQYVDDRYPYRCDFYIKEDDLFIELNAHWVHGGHPFDPNSEADQHTLAEWKEKAKTSKFYENAIVVWTQRDVEKLQTAKQNKLNYKVIY